MDVRSRPSAEATAVIDAVEQIADEFIRIAMRYDVSSRELEMAIRRRFVARAVEEAEERGGDLTARSLAVRAGLTEFCVNAAVESDRRRRAEGNTAARLIDEMASLLNEWHTNPRFSGPFGLPGALRLSAEFGDEQSPTFSLLVEHAAPSSDPRAALSILLETGSVVIDREAGLVRCIAREFIPLNKNLPQIQRYGRCLQTLARTLRFNMTEFPPGEGYFERMLVTDQTLTEAQRDRFHSRVWETGQAWLSDLDTQLSSVRGAASWDVQGKHYGVGLFFFELPDKLAMIIENTEGVGVASGAQEIDLVQGA